MNDNGYREDKEEKRRWHGEDERKEKEEKIARRRGSKDNTRRQKAQIGSPRMRSANVGERSPTSTRDQGTVYIAAEGLPSDTYQTSEM